MNLASPVMTQDKLVSEKSNDARIVKSGLAVDPQLVRFIEEEALPGTRISASTFWQGLAKIADEFTPRNRQLLAQRDTIQAQIDSWHDANLNAASGVPEGELRQMGYLVEEPAPFTIGTTRTDPEIASLFGAQLVVPVLNARFVLNAANARWGSLYDALYGTDALGLGPAPSGGYDAERGAAVIAWAKAFLDEAVPLEQGSWTDWQGGVPALAETSQFAGTAGENILLRHNGLHIELVIDPQHPIGSTDKAGLADILLEAALSTIVDMEDSVAAVDAEDKVSAYRNWLGLMQGTLEAKFAKGGKEMTRSMVADRHYTAADGTPLLLSGRSLLLVRNVGHLMTNPAVLLPDGAQIGEGILDAAVTSLIALHDLEQAPQEGAVRLRNSDAGSVYIVKPKMHGPEECALTNDLFDAVEDMLELERHTIKVGVMDEERRTSANLAACIHAVKDRIFFINTGFLDRTGDEIHTSMRAGPFQRKADIKNARWIAAYEDRNVQIGLSCGFSGKAQIGKGMWAAPDQMQAMLEQKIGHPQSGASTAWVPSPTAAVLHAVHYHRCDVSKRQHERAAEPIAPLAHLLDVPLASNSNWSAPEIAEELDNNVQGILGYVVRWVALGVGCSKVPDIHGVGLMEDRATLRISSQHIANWLRHGIVSPQDVDASLQRMAKVVDEQNAGDAAYLALCGSAEGELALDAARALIFAGEEQPNGYTEPLLHQYRERVKAL